MSKHMILNLASALSITATGIQAPIRCNTTPFQGGQGKSAVVDLDVVPAGGGVVKIQGHPAIGATAPAAGDAGWVDIVSLTASSPLTQEIELPSWIRVNVTTVGTGAITINLEGVQ